MAGAGYKLFNTGDVLTAAQVNTYLMEQTVMVFADATARTTALTGIVSEGMISYLKDTNAVEVYNGSAWVASDDPNAIQNTIVDAKGDLISATAADTPARLASSGNNGDVLTVDTSTSTGLKWAAPAASGDTFAAGKNKVLNGDFNIWQRGTSFTGASPYYTADRFVGLRATAALGATFSRQSSGLTSFQYSIRVQRDSGNTGTTALILSQCLESATSYPLAGKSVTLSFYAKCGANYSSASSALSSQIRYGTGTDQNYITGSYTGDTQVVAGTHTLTTSWQRFSITGTVNSAATEVGFDLRYTPVGTASTNDWFEVTGIQLEIGSTATDFQTATGTLAGELAACRRYFRLGGAGGFGQAYSGSSISFMFQFDTQMRTTPTVSANGQGNVVQFGVGVTTTSTWTPGSVYGTANGIGLDVTTNAFGYTTGDRVGLSNNSLFFSSEL